MNKIYYKSIDYTKIICAILVVCIHTGPLLSLNREWNFFLVQILGRIAVPFFFVASAFFFFRKIDSNESLKSEKNLTLLKQYLKRLCKMYLIWSLIYLTIQVPIWIKDGFTIHTFFIYIRDFFFLGSYYHLWFLPGLIVATTIIYFLLLKMKCEKIFIIAFILYIVGMLINVYGDFLMNIPILSTLLNLYLTIFATARNGLFFGCVYVFMGYLFARREFKFNHNIKINLALLLLSFILLILEAYMIRYLGYMNDLTSMYITLIPCTYYLFILLLGIKSCEKANLQIRNSGTLLYFSHCYFAFIMGLIPLIRNNSLIYFSFVLLFSFLFILVYLKLSKKHSILRSIY